MNRIFIRGLLAITPLAVTVALVIWIFSALEKTFSYPLRSVIGPYYFPGLGILVALVFIFFIGTIINNWLIQKIYSLGDQVLRKIPFIKTLYNSISDVTSFFDTSQKDRLGQVVSFEVQGIQALGFITREVAEDASDKLQTSDQVAVYVPFSYQIGGFTFLIPRKQIQKVEMSVDEAMRFILTAGILKDHKKSKELTKKEEP